MTLLLEAENLGYAAGGTQIVAGVDLEVAPGEIVAVIGPNGAGKSTLVGMLAGDLPPATGWIRLLGEELGELDPLERALRRAVVPQHIPADVPFSVRTVVGMGRHPHQVTGTTSPQQDQDAVDRALATFDIADRCDLPFAALSGGEQRRTALARAMAQDVPLLLLDEPAAALDIGHQEQVMRALRRWTDAEGAVVAVLHDLNLAAAHADRILVMHQGSIAAAGTPHDVLTAGLLAAVYRHPMRVERHPTRDCPIVIVVD